MKLLIFFEAGFSSRMDPPLPLPSPVNPEPLLRILADHGFQRIIDPLGIGHDILLDISGVDDLKGPLD